MKDEKFPLTITEKGVSAVIRKTEKVKGGKKLNYFIVEYTLLGEREQVWRSDLGVAKALARDACIKIANGDQSALELRNGERLAYTRAIEALSLVRIPIDTACRDFADALQILGGKASVTEACREWVKRNEASLPKITVSAASQLLQRQANTDGKSDMRQKQLRVALDRFSKSFNVEVHTLTPGQVSTYLASLTLAERSKKNHRDVLKYFSRWLVLRGYLPKGTDLMEGVQKYAARKFGAISIFTPDELKSLLTKADKRLRAFLAIGAFAGLRHSEIKRLDYEQVELSDKPSESFIEVLPIEKTKSDQRRRLVPVKDNLKAWLRPLVKKSGPVCPFKNVVNQFGKLARDAGVKWKKNGLRHSFVSYRVTDEIDFDAMDERLGSGSVDAPDEHVAQTGDSAEFVALLDWLDGPRAEAYFGKAFTLRLVALSWVNNPASFQGDSLSEIAKKRGITVQALSKYAAQASRIFGLRNRSQRTHGKRWSKN